MTDQKYQQFLKIITTAAQYYRYDLQDIEVKMIWRMIGKWETRHIQHAVDKHIADPDRGRWMPKAADLIKYLEQYPPDGMEWDPVRGAWKRALPNNQARLNGGRHRPTSAKKAHDYIKEMQNMLKRGSTIHAGADDG